MIGTIVGTYKVIAFLDRDVYQCECQTCGTKQRVVVGAWNKVCENRYCGKDTDPIKTEWLAERQAEIDAENYQRLQKEQSEIAAIKDAGKTEGRQEAVNEMKDANQGILRDLKVTQNTLATTENALREAKDTVARKDEEIASLKKQIPPPLTTALERRQYIVSSFIDSLPTIEAQTCWEYIKASGLDGTDPQVWLEAHSKVKQGAGLQRLKDRLKK